MPDSSFSKLHSSIKDIALKAVETSKPSGLFYGTVLSIAPLEIQIDQKIILDSDFLILSTLVQDFNVDMTVAHLTEPETQHTHVIHDTYSGGGTSDPTSHLHEYKGRKTFTVHLGLNVGEKVILMRVQGGNQYLVLDRIREG